MRPAKLAHQNRRCHDDVNAMTYGRSRVVWRGTVLMSFLRHWQIYHPMWSFSLCRGRALQRPPPASSSDEFATGYSLAGCTPAWGTRPVIWTIRKGTGIGVRSYSPERRQLRPRAHWCLSSPTCSVVLDPVLNTVMTSAVERDCGGSRLGDYFVCTPNCRRIASGIVTWLLVFTHTRGIGDLIVKLFDFRFRDEERRFQSIPYGRPKTTIEPPAAAPMSCFPSDM
jgi:hypothetical protein